MSIDRACLARISTPLLSRHFAKEDLPRIRWANPNIDIQVERIPKAADHEWRPELEIQFGASLISPRQHVTEVHTSVRQSPRRFRERQIHNTKPREQILQDYPPSGHGRSRWQILGSA